MVEASWFWAMFLGFEVDTGTFHYGSRRMVVVGGTVLTAGIKVARVFGRRSKILVPMAILRTNPYMMARIGAIRGSNCDTMRIKCISGGRGVIAGSGDKGGSVTREGNIAGTRGNRFSGTNMSKGECMGRFEFRGTRRCALTRRVGTSVFTTKSGISTATISGNGNFRNTVGHRGRDEKPVARNSGFRHRTNSGNSTSSPDGMFGNGGVPKRVNGGGVAIRGLRMMEISTRGGLVLIGNSMPKPGGYLMAVGRAIGTG